MTAIKDLAEATYSYSMELSPVLSDMFSYMEPLLDTAIALQEKLAEMEYLTIAFYLPQTDDHEGAPEKESTGNIINTENISIKGPMSVFQMAYNIEDAYRETGTQNFSSLSNIYSMFSYAAPSVIGETRDIKDRYSPAGLDIHSIPAGQKETSSAYNELVSSASMIKELESVSDVISNESLKSVDVSEASNITGMIAPIEGSSSITIDNSTIGNIKTNIINEEKNIEMPALIPGRLADSFESTKMNSVRLNEAIKSSISSISNQAAYNILKEDAEKYSGINEKATGRSLQEMSLVLNEYISIVSAMNEELTDAFGSSHETRISMNEMLMSTENSIFTQLYDNTSFTGNISGGSSIMSLSYGISTSKALQNAGSEAIQYISSISPYNDPVLSGTGPMQVPRAMESVLQAMSDRLPQVERASKSDYNFHNTFNISVSVKGGNDEAELRELGRKIGMILSEELKRYGGH